MKWISIEDGMWSLCNGTFGQVATIWKCGDGLYEMEIFIRSEIDRFKSRKDAERHAVTVIRDALQGAIEELNNCQHTEEP